MDKLKNLQLAHLTLYDELIKDYISKVDTGALKTVTFNSETRELKFYKEETVTEDSVAIFVIELPEEQEISGFADNIYYDEENSELQLKSGENILSTTTIKSGSNGNSGYIVYPEFEMNFDTGHLTATGGAGVEFSVNENGHLESEVL